MNLPKFKYSTLVIFLALYVPFEVIILKYLPVSDRIYSALRFVPEVLIYLLLILNIVHNIYHRHWISRTPIDLALFLFVVSAIISIIVNSAPLVLSIIGMRPLLRYVALFYLVSNIDIPSSRIKFFIIAIILVGGLQSVFISYQHFAGISKMFMPRATDLEVEGVQSQFRMVQTGWGSGREQGAGIGTFGDSVLVALFLVFITILSLCYYLKNKIRVLIYKVILIGIFLLSLIALFYSYSRASVLIAIAAIPIVLFLEKKIKRLLFMGSLSIVILSGVLFLSANSSSTTSAYYNPKSKYTSPIDNITSIFSQSYVDHNMEHSRGWVISNIGWQLLSSMNLFGYGPSADEALDRMVKDNVGHVTPFANLGIINDVYWVAMLCFYGFIGLFIYLFILWRLFNVSYFVNKNSKSSLYSSIALSLTVIIIITIPYTFIIRTFLFRPFGFYFWMFAGLVAAEHRRIKTNEMIQVKSEEV